MSKVNAREKMEAWRSACIAEIAPLVSMADEIVSEAKRLRTAAGRAVKKATRAASKMSEAMGAGIEDRKTEVWEALVGELGEADAAALIDTEEYPSTDEEDERDEGTRSQLDEIPSPDVEDSMGQAIESLETLEGGLSELLSSLRGIK